MFFTPSIFFVSALPESKACNSPLESCCEGENLSVDIYSEIAAQLQVYPLLLKV